jgi:hypothetical protein
VPDRVGHLVYLDAEVPGSGQSEMDLLPQDERATYEQTANEHGDGWRIPPPVPNPLPAGLPPEVTWAMSRFVPQPLSTFTQPLHLSGTHQGARRTYVLHTEGKEGQDLPEYVQRIRNDPDWGFVELAAGHSAHVTAPRQLADLLISLA